MLRATPIPDAARRRPGFTLVEATISIVLVGIVLVAALGTLGATARMRHVANEESRGPELARQLLSEILAAAFEDPEEPDRPLGADTGESDDPSSRSQWDDVDDYDGLVEAPLVYHDDTPVPDSDGWSRTVVVQYADPVTLADQGNTRTGLKSIKVTASAPDGTLTVLTALRANGGSLEQPPPVDTTYVTWVGVELEPRDGEGVVSSGVSLPNHAEAGP